MGNEFDAGDVFSTNKPKTTGFKSTSRRLRTAKESHLSHRTSLDWRQDQIRVCDRSVPPADIVTIEELQAILVKSRTGEALLQEAQAKGLQIHYDTQTPLSQFYPRETGCIITMNPYRPKGDLMNIMVRELRRAWQYHHGALVNPMSFEPDEAVLVNRAQQADVMMLSIKVAWELKLVGECEAWDFMTYSPMADVTRTFEIHAQKDFRTLNNGEAARATYDKFFEGARTKLHDKRIIHQMLLDDNGYMKAPGKRPRAGVELFAQLGEMPHGRNYLSIRNQKSPTDHCYATVEDRSNANFLWFIKFERSFQAKELEMIKESVKKSAEIVDFAQWTARSRQQPSAG